MLKERNKHILNFSKFNESFLNKSILKRMEATHCRSEKEYYDMIEHNDIEVKHLSDSLMINYSEFFRNPLTFAVLERIVLPEIIMQKKKSNRKEIRIWSSACAGGQEAYSIAMLLEDMQNYNKENISYRIFASDQSELQINSAINGIFPIVSMNNINLKRLKQWFKKTGDKYTVKPELKERIDFSVFDLFDNNLSCPPVSIFGDFDIVFCANLLFYFKHDYQQMILEKISNCLTLGGYLISGEAEREILMQNKFNEVFPQSAIFRNNNKRKVL